MQNTIEIMEAKLDSFDRNDRAQALKALKAECDQGKIVCHEAGKFVNLHCHTFFSYNAYGYSPSKFAWLARKAGLAAAGIVDFDVLDGVDEFLNASKTLGLKGCAGIETRVFVSEFGDKVINSPGEPGIAYHMGTGITKTEIPPGQASFQKKLTDTSRGRNLQIISKVNDFLDPVRIDYDKDVLPLTPAGNATERHLCTAYARKAKHIFTNDEHLLEFWSGKLSCPAQNLQIPESPSLINAIRAKTMKRGGVGYVHPDCSAFPKMCDMNSFVLGIGGIPTLAWLDGTSEGEQDIEALIDIAAKSGTAAINIIPDRNYSPGVKDGKLAELNRIIEIAVSRDLPVIAGTEMNSPGNKFVDSFESAELAPFVNIFYKGAMIVYAHSVLQQYSKMGYPSPWAARHFAGVKEKNEFFEEFGMLMQPEKEISLTGISEELSPAALLRIIKS